MPSSRMEYPENLVEPVGDAVHAQHPLNAFRRLTVACPLPKKIFPARRGSARPEPKVACAPAIQGLVREEPREAPRRKSRQIALHAHSVRAISSERIAARIRLVRCQSRTQDDSRRRNYDAWSGGRKFFEIAAVHPCIHVSSFVKAHCAETASMAMLARLRQTLQKYCFGEWHKAECPTDFASGCKKHEAL